MIYWPKYAGTAVHAQFTLHRWTSCHGWGVKDKIQDMVRHARGPQRMSNTQRQNIFPQVVERAYRLRQIIGRAAPDYERVVGGLALILHPEDFDYLKHDMGEHMFSPHIELNFNAPMGQLKVCGIPILPHESATRLELRAVPA